MVDLGTEKGSRKSGTNRPDLVKKNLKIGPCEKADGTPILIGFN
jgi:hypothetical protein